MKVIPCIVPKKVLKLSMVSMFSRQLCINTNIKEFLMCVPSEYSSSLCSYQSPPHPPSSPICLNSTCSLIPPNSLNGGCHSLPLSAPTRKTSRSQFYQSLFALNIFLPLTVLTFPLQNVSLADEIFLSGDSFPTMILW